MEEILLSNIPPEAFVALIISIGGGWILLTIADQKKSAGYPVYFRTIALTLGIVLFFGGLILTFLFIYPALKEFYSLVVQDINSIDFPEGILQKILLVIGAIILFLLFYKKYKARKLEPKITVMQASEITRTFVVDWSPVIVQNKNWYGQKMPTYAGIRIDKFGGAKCEDIEAKFKSIVKIKSNSEKEAMILNEINPTNQLIGWSNNSKCMLVIADEKPQLLFENMWNYEINTGTYELHIDLSSPGMKTPYEIKVTLEIKRSYSKIVLRWKDDR